MPQTPFTRNNVNLLASYIHIRHSPAYGKIFKVPNVSVDIARNMITISSSSEEAKNPFEKLIQHFRPESRDVRSSVTPAMLIETVDIANALGFNLNLNCKNASPEMANAIESIGFIDTEDGDYVRCPEDIEYERKYTSAQERYESEGACSRDIAFRMSLAQGGRVGEVNLITERLENERRISNLYEQEVFETGENGVWNKAPLFCNVPEPEKGLMMATDFAGEQARLNSGIAQYVASGAKAVINNFLNKFKAKEMTHSNV